MHSCGSFKFLLGPLFICEMQIEDVGCNSSYHLEQFCHSLHTGYTIEVGEFFIFKEPFTFEVVEDL